MSTAKQRRADKRRFDIRHCRLLVPPEVALNAAVGGLQSADCDGRVWDSHDWPDGKRVLVGAMLVNQLNFEGHHGLADEIQAVLARRWPGRFVKEAK